MLSVSIALLCTDSHFWRPNNFWGEPRLEKDFLFTGEASFGGGGTCHGYDKNGHLVSLLDIYGHHKLHHIADGVTGLDPTHPLDRMLLDLNAVPDRYMFGTICYTAQFELLEMYIRAWQNFKHGFFLYSYLPIRSLELVNIIPKDLTPNDTVFPNASTKEWHHFLEAFPKLCKRYHITTEPFKQTGIGDIPVDIGWTHTWCNFRHLDFIDVMLKTGCVFPTGRKTDTFHAFDIPHGYDGHFGIEASLDIAFGLFDWITVGGHAYYLGFKDVTKNIRIKTSAHQNGFLKLTQACVPLHHGPLRQAGVYFKADHVIQGLSTLIAYTYTHQDKRSIIGGSKIANSDTVLSGFIQHVLNIIVEYDFTREPYGVGPRIGIFYNKTLGGIRVFATAVTTTYTGLEISYVF